MATTAGGLQLSLPPSFNHRYKTSLRIEQPISPSICAALSKQGHRFLTSVATTDDPATTDRLIRKFVASSSKSVALDAISHLVSPNNTSFSRLSPLAFPLVADVIASLCKHQRFDEAQTLVSEVETKLGGRERDLCNFYCNLIDSHSKHRSKHEIFDSYERINQLPSHSSSNYLKKRSYESIIGGLSVIDLPHEAESFMVEMKNKGLRPSVFEYRSLSYAYGRLGLFEDMKRVICLMEDEGFELDVVSSNMVISSLGSHNELKEMVSWLQRMKNSKISFSIRTYNSVLNHCPTIMSFLEHPKEIKPTSLEALFQILKDDECILIRELVEPSVLAESMVLTSLELKLDLHGMHLGSAYLILLQWFDDISMRYATNNEGIPNKVTVVCGAGKHSVIRGESPVKELVKEMLIQMKSPLKIDRKNVGCFVAHGKVFINWLCQISKTSVT
ncbi:pentatricopeptide repeat-containing protein At2g17033 isoform X2 [Cynara cardunculus var. scolymus]|uniref:pentatricopeptide repeat-containing protein At2g17033 isoform X2 n=1 Tax=Cynara cardunculus var. scolymus TaxID=59895 RepID=UPI000D624ECA|nr:pentatricopeptide repeat-containing protein At2g17033 isoform X2 [Cynara cardunculus var. scolymus]